MLFTFDSIEHSIAHFSIDMLKYETILFTYIISVVQYSLEVERDTFGMATAQENQLPQQTSSASKGKFFESQVFRITFYIILAAICNGLLVAAAYTSQAKFPIPVIILFSLIPTVILGIAFAIIQGFDDRTRDLQKHIDTYEQTIDNYERTSELLNINLTKVSEELNSSSIGISANLSNTLLKTMEQVEQISIANERAMEARLLDFHELVKDTGIILNFYGSIRTLLEDGYKQRNLIHTFLKRAMSGPLFIQPVDEVSFFDLADEGIQQCTIWQAIHQGPISQLPDVTYLKNLQANNQLTKKQRIVILTKEEAEELNNPTIVANFLSATDGTDSFWIDSDTFYQTFDIIPSRMRLDDAALHDEKLLILRQRETKLVMLAFQGHQDRAFDGIYQAFQTLELDLAIKKVETGQSVFKRIEPFKKTP